MTESEADSSKLDPAFLSFEHVVSLATELVHPDNLLTAAFPALRSFWQGSDSRSQVVLLQAQQLSPLVRHCSHGLFHMFVGVLPRGVEVMSIAFGTHR